ncbi:nuclear exosome regulator NRDE2 [Musca domestica]|uniref:Nuclear exosome regulator NRDE2 n=1 Tax=Musca domestica TaxID=7370 RepID=A0A1I8N8J0_MUSDO|nr:nuclear exosome regulator NRDE2 [Musca domestica]XP_011295178.1 nuclear exosome regulator NRDE2 [Musca domestica]XP_011295179.1 nuclear exosome regulator NRDE2 [Musca domestica]XP_011295180.1 nuclear exosome regulator NRDE2 [Musca domestica]XP_019894650.1 nuclear exosome regulator NRDE2 [Musca domestica]XP_058987476.1 nuclear exosome regulator NRDE2 [Musca domestica]
MSLFPAYSEENAIIPETNTDQPATSGWLENTSFPLDVIKFTAPQGTPNNVIDDYSTSNSDSSVLSHSDSGDSNGEREHKKRKKDKKAKSKKKAKHKTSSRPASPVPTFEPLLDFTGKEEFYVDKNKAKQYNSIKTLHKPACPRYRVNHYTLGRAYGPVGKVKSKRYYHCTKYLDNVEKNDNDNYPLTENEYTSKMSDLNRKTMENCREIQNWLDLIALQDRNPYKWSRLRIAEKKIDYIEKALNFHPFHKDLYSVYIETITQCYTSHDVSKMLDSLLAKDPHSLILWQAQIMCTQGTMARCTVPDVLRIYERCLKKMFHSPKSQQITASDQVMMQLFYACALFLRQSGLYEQFLSLIKLSVELNVPANSCILEDLQPREQDEQTCVEYEELILQSGLPMNEIWLRIEKLRQGFFFLPFPGESTKCSDPQRIVFNEDVCHYVYPLQSTDNCLKMLLLIVKLLKVPFIGSHCLAMQLEGETDAIEDLLALYINPNYNLSLDHKEFFESLYDLSKEMACNPSFLNHCIGHDIYSECLQKFLINCAKAYEQIDDRKRLLFLILWSRFQCLLLKLAKISKKISTDFVKNGRKLFKSLLKLPNNRNCLSLYVEFARYEYAADSPLETVENIFKNLISVYNQDDNTNSELAYVYLTYGEILINSKNIERISSLFSAYVLACDVSQITSAKKLIGVNTLKEKLENLIKIEENVNIMLLEQYILPDNTVTQVKIYTLLLYALQQKQQALEYIQKLLARFSSGDNPRHQYLREQFYEILVNLLQMPGGNSYVSNTFIQKSIERALSEYPSNLLLLQKWGCQTSLPWFKLRRGYLAIGTSIKSIIFLIALARCRFINSLSDIKGGDSSNTLSAVDLHYQEMIVRQRILNLFKMIVHLQSTNTTPCSVQSSLLSLRRNSLFWRCYLRCLSDQSCSFELSKQCLLTALDECPWSKALYLDGATFVPQELSHLQDLIIEKQLRIYALPEELEILRER